MEKEMNKKNVEAGNDVKYIIMSLSVIFVVVWSVMKSPNLCFLIFNA